MDNESMINVRKQFLNYIGPVKFRQFVRALHDKPGRLRFWQEQLWKRFTYDKGLAIPVDREEIIKILKTDYEEYRESEQAVCDECEAGIEKGEGFIFYSSAHITISEDQNSKFLCKSCTENIVNEKGYKKKVSQQELTEWDILEDVEKVLEAMKKASAASIVEHCKKHKLTPREAKEKANQFALMWWEDWEKAMKEAKSFWQS